MYHCYLYQPWILHLFPVRLISNKYSGYQLGGVMNLVILSYVFIFQTMISIQIRNNLMSLIIVLRRASVKTVN